MKDAIISTDVDVILLDIDGTIKDLVKEHSEALIVTVNGFVHGKNLRKKFVFFLDRIAMSMVKSGVFSTNKRKQRFLLGLYAFILGMNKKEFCKLYDVFYSEQLIIFSNVKEMLEDALRKKQVYLVTINSQNYNLENLDVPREDIICAARFNNKLDAYKKVVFEKRISPARVLVVGDNLVDDIIPAEKLGFKYLLVDNYNSKFKRFVAKIFKVGIA